MTEGFVFRDEFLEALGAWQKGWREDPALRETLAVSLLSAAFDLPEMYKAVAGPCFRKRFLYPVDLPKLFFAELMDEGLTSWTSNFSYAQEFKGIYRPDAITAAIFAHHPNKGEVLLNTSVLWSSPDFLAALDHYVARRGINYQALQNFAAKQFEVVMLAPLRIADVVGFSARSDPFDDLCEQAGINDQDQRDKIYKQLIETGTFPDEHRWMFQASALRVISRVQDRVEILFNELRAKGVGSTQPPTPD